MRRLLAYLFIVLGLGLTFTVSVKAEILKIIYNSALCPGCQTEAVQFKNIDEFDNWLSKKINEGQFPWVWKGINSNYDWSSSKGSLGVKMITINSEEDINLYNNVYSKLEQTSYGKRWYNHDKHYHISVGALNEIIKLKKTQIAKAEPTKTQKIKDKNAYVLNGHNNEVTLFVPFGSSDMNFVAEKYCNKFGKSISSNFKQQKYSTIQNGVKGTIITYSCTGDIKGTTNSKKEVKVAKKETSQTQTVAKKINKETQKQTKGINIIDIKLCKSRTGVYPIINKCPKTWGLDVPQIPYKEYLTSSTADKTICYSKNEKRVQFRNKCYKDKEQYEVKYDGENFYWSSDGTQIAKSETAIAPKKKVEVAKKEEFKPDNKDIEAPVIEIAEAITVNDSTYEIEGKVIDKSKKLFVQIDGETIPVRNGKFKVTRFSPVDEQLKIVAIDQWGNKSKPKLVNITIDIKGTELVEKLEQLNPSLIKSKPNKNRVALIIGIEKYEQTPDANFANLDAKYFYEYARKGFGISKANINLLVDEDASLIKSISTINKWLPSKIKKNQTELIIFFAGHGLASNDGKELYLLPQDSDPDLLSRTALSRTELFEQIIKLSPKSVTMFMDTCYSGISRDEKMLLASARPIRIVANDKDGIPANFTIFSASKLDQISSGLKEAEHGIFSYFLMKGLEGKADLNKDKEITNGELLAYMDQNVSQKASELGRQQNPSLAGDPDKVLMSFR